MAGVGIGEDVEEEDGAVVGEDEEEVLEAWDTALEAL